MTETDPKAAIGDIVTVVGSSLFQPLADLMDKLLAKQEPAPYPSGTSSLENGYSVAIVVLLNVALESYVARLRFCRQAEVENGKTVPGQLGILFPDLPTLAELEDVYMVGKIAAHNHIWNLDVSNVDVNGAPTLMNPKDLGMATKKDYERIVDIDSRKTKLLRLNASPTAIDRHDVKTVFDVIWSTLEFMQAKNYGHTPLHAHRIKFRGEFANFGALRSLFPSAPAKPETARTA